MSYVRFFALASVVVAATGCRHHVAKTTPTQEPVQVQYADGASTTTTTNTLVTPPPTTGPSGKSPGQVVVDSLTAKGYTCTPTDDKWSCSSGATGDWPFIVSWLKEDAQTTIRFDSYVQRAFAHKCGEFRNHMDDLAVADDFYSITCDDGTQRFQFDTAVKYIKDVNADGWAKNHIANRDRSQLLLSKTGASVDLHAKP